jgi:flagellum-specific ATP synthase
VNHFLDAVRQADLVRRVGTVSEFFGLMVEAIGPDAAVGELCELYPRGHGTAVPAEVIGLKEGRVLLMPYADLGGVSLGAEVIATGRSAHIDVGDALLGRVIDAFGAPLDGKPAPLVRARQPLYPPPINPLRRTRIREVLETGVRALDAMLTVGRGQRVGIFSGSGVGKSTLLGMIARNARADVSVVALVGERGREVRDFIEDTLGPEGLRRSVVVAVTSDQPALVRRRAAFAATAIAEHFRDRGLHTVLMMDSLTRFAMAQREIGLAVGEPPTARGYTPSVFALLPRLLERGGNGENGGSLTAFYSVLVEADDMNDPIADSVRAILDGHIVLDREIAHRGRFPAIDVLQSVSRLLPDLASGEELDSARQALKALTLVRASRDLVEVGAYRAGTNPDLDQALRVAPALEALFAQASTQRIARADAMRELRSALSGKVLH